MVTIMKLVLQISMFIIPSTFLTLIKYKQNKEEGILKQFILFFVFINTFVYAVSYFKGVKIISLNNMTYSYCIKWLIVGMTVAICYLVWEKYILKYWKRLNTKTKFVTILILQALFLSIYFLLFCCKVYPSIEITDKMYPSEYTYMDDSGAWYINDNSDYKAHDIILSGPYLSMEKGAYTITVDYDSNYAQYMIVQSAKNSAELETELGRILGGGEQIRKTYIRVNGALDDLDIQILYSGKGDIRIKHIWIEENNALSIEYIVIIIVLFLVWDIWKYLYNIRKVQYPTKQLVKVLGCSFLSTTAIAVSGKVNHDGTLLYLIRNESNGVGIVYLIAGIAIFILYKRYLISEEKYSNVIKILSGIFSVCMIIGISMLVNGDLRFILNSPLQFSVCIFTAVGYYILFRTCLVYIFRKLDTMQLNVALKVNKKHTYGVTIGILGMMWLPVWICFWPASVSWDGFTQLDMALGVTQLSNHHPWLSTMLMKIFYEIGLMVNDNMGVFLVALSNIIIELMIYSYVCYKIRLSAGDILYIVAVLFYGINPLFSVFGQLIMKDGLYAAVFTLYMIFYVDCVLESKRKETISNKKWCLLALIAIAVCALRKNGVYVVLPSYLCLLIIVTSGRKKLLIFGMGCSIACSFIMIDRVIPDKLEIQQGSAREMLSIPFQQTARYFRDYEDEVTDYEFKVVDKVLDAERLKEIYTPTVSNNVKDTYKGGETNEGLSEYFEVWAAMLLKHPLTYLEAALANSYGYYYPFENIRSYEHDYTRIAYQGMTGDIDVYYIFPYEIRNKIGGYIYYAWSNLPILSLLVHAGFYTWLLLVAAGHAVFHKRYRDLIIYVAPFMHVLVCIVSPLNASSRYALPLMAASPILVCWCYISSQPLQGTEKISKHLSH